MNDSDLHKYRRLRHCCKHGLTAGTVLLDCELEVGTLFSVSPTLCLVPDTQCAINMCWIYKYLALTFWLDLIIITEIQGWIVKFRCILSAKIQKGTRCNGSKKEPTIWFGQKVVVQWVKSLPLEGRARSHYSEISEHAAQSVSFI